MQTNHANAIKGLSIAVIVIAALGVIGSLVGMIAMGAMAPYMEYASTTLEYSNGYYTYSDDALAAQILMTMGGAMFAWALICCAVTLVAGIIGLRNYNNPQKLGMVFGWAIVGAILSFIGAGLITAILLIIVAVYANKDKQMAAAGTYDQGAVPVQPAAAPMVQPMAAPAAAAQPVATPTQAAPVPVQTQPEVAAQPVAQAAQPVAQPATQPVTEAVQVTETVVEEQNPYNPNSL